MTTKSVEVEVEVIIDIDETLCSNAITRCTENEDNWRGFYYDLDTEDKVYEHFAFNCLMNGYDDVNHLDGWADVPKGAVRMRVDRRTAWSRVI